MLGGDLGVEEDVDNEGALGGGGAETVLGN